MSQPGEWDWLVWVGNTSTFRFGITDDGGAVDLTSSVFVLTISWPGGTFSRRSDDGLGVVVKLDQTDPLTKGWVRITLTPALTRNLPVGERIRYEIERRWSGLEKTYLTGAVIAATENNTDG